MSSHQCRRLRLPSEGRVSARWVLPIVGPPVEYGSVTFENDRVTSVVPQPEPVDWPTAAILPGLVNGHVHFDLSANDCSGFASRELPEWLAETVRSRVEQTPETTQAGIAAAVEAGTAAAADITSDSAEPRSEEERLHRVRFLECLGLDEGRWEPIVRGAVDFLARCPHAGLSPHAPYSVPLDLLGRLVAVAGDRPVMMHLAEHPGETGSSAVRRSAMCSIAF